eukprot:symbB.v1.2.022847.t1/scaffold2045.1/size91218/8
MQMVGENIWDCVSLRLWDFLEAPEDLRVRPVCRSLEALPSWLDSERGGSALQVPHLALSMAILPWAQKHVCLSSLESLRLFARTDDQVESNAEGLFSEVLCWFAKEGGESWVRWLLVCIPEDGRLRAGEGQCQGPAAGKALLAAAGSGQVPVLQCLLEASADVKTSDENDCTALHWAADQGHAEACELLLKFGAQVDDEDDDARGLRQVWSDVKRKLHRKSQAWTPLCLAAEEGHLKTCEVLLSFGATVSIPDEDLRSPLWWAAWRKHDALVELLLRHRADVNQTDRWGVSPRTILNDSAPIARRCPEHL